MQFERAQIENQDCKQLWKYARTGNSKILPSNRYFSIRDKVKLTKGYLYKKGTNQLLVVNNKIEDAINLVHTGIGASHVGITKTLELLKRSYYWPSNFF
ncbi:hypothetical protein A3Q56_02210 [Intoshia linei]|uniref:Integrase zinc-binding domain-containing protein n=1 Tax=Intoshia linei TaxID=1819745 RepID=A0A177B9D1_9BILA|nr:hypothetical protein A3Q56_02210 [Intoshia linei]